MPNKDAIKEAPDSFNVSIAGVGDTFFIAKAFVVVQDVNKAPVIPDAQAGDIAIGLKLAIFNPITGVETKAEPIYLIRGREVVPQVTGNCPH